MKIEMKGPISDFSPPLGGQLHKWKFINLTGESIFAFQIAIGPLENKSLPRVKRATLTIEGESELLDLFSEPVCFDLKVHDLFQYREAIQFNESFEIQLALSNFFPKDSYIQFIPLDRKRTSIISVVENIPTFVEETRPLISDKNNHNEVANKFLYTPFAEDTDDEE